MGLDAIKGQMGALDDSHIEMEVVDTIATDIPDNFDARQ
jgi:hypothetical protein